MIVAGLPYIYLISRVETHTAAPSAAAAAVATTAVATVVVRS